MNLEQKIRYYTLLRKHREMVAAGNMHAAAILFRFLLNRRVSCGLSDSAWEISCLLEGMGFKPYVSRSGNYSDFRL